MNIESQLCAAVRALQQIEASENYASGRHAAQVAREALEVINRSRGNDKTQSSNQ